MAGLMMFPLDPNEKKKAFKTSKYGSGQSHFQLAFQKIEETDTELRSEGMNFNFAAAQGSPFFQRHFVVRRI